ncbi:hypothetical protein RTM1035_09169 [Roseovarius sp. TM1035]|nr:hypothetical protein RTM1035_09169 [Roseovarius sp. TM1035]
MRYLCAPKVRFLRNNCDAIWAAHKNLLGARCFGA